LKKGGIVEKRGEEETKSMPQVPVHATRRVSLVTNTVINHECGMDREVLVNDKWNIPVVICDTDIP
jgi:hypothetical protein